jgi:hypothetical protein
MIGLLGASSLWVFRRPLIFGVEGLRFTYFHFLSLGIISLHSLMAFLILRCSLLVMSWVDCLKLLLLLAIKVRTLLLYSSSYIIIRELPLSAFVTIALDSSSFLFICFTIFISFLLFLSAYGCLPLYCLYTFLRLCATWYLTCSCFWVGSRVIALPLLMLNYSTSVYLCGFRCTSVL